MMVAVPWGPTECMIDMDPAQILVAAPRDTPEVQLWQLWRLRLSRVFPLLFQLS